MHFKQQMPKRWEFVRKWRARNRLFEILKYTHDKKSTNPHLRILKILRDLRTPVNLGGQLDVMPGGYIFLLPDQFEISQEAYSAMDVWLRLFSEFKKCKFKSRSESQLIEVLLLLISGHINARAEWLEWSWGRYNPPTNGSTNNPKTTEKE